MALTTAIPESFYLSKLFHKEIGIPVSEYIMLQKVEKAKNLLCYSDYSIVDIANYLTFSSQSHFIQVFQKFAGLTPRKYRDRYFRRQRSNKRHCYTT
ncbi:MAG: helix-turn-helix transcriptional regulator [Lachnospiraceae bacterium]|nr:helix-turn-helix transcriptional regulator [Lachnospiraceae bacterium]